MNILYLSPAITCDYMCDMLFHGLRQLTAHTVTDIPRIPYLYSDYPDTSTLYGRGFTLYGLLPNLAVNRANIKERIASKEFDLIIYGSIQRDQQYLGLVTANYPRERVLFIDGEDHPKVLNLSHLGIYFKRELQQPLAGVHPIHFAIPVSKIGTIKPTLKSQVRASSDPRDPATYIYKEERAYYADYSCSLFGFTMKKAGWDTLRHLEIMANGCIPLFLDLADCPELTCTHLPKAELLEALTYKDHDGTFWDTEDGHNLWKSLWRRIHLKFVFHSTTQALAQHVLEIQHQEAHEHDQASH